MAGERLRGTLDNQPEDMPGLSLGMSVAFRRRDVVAVRWASKRFEKPPPSTQSDCLSERVQS